MGEVTLGVALTEVEGSRTGVLVISLESKRIGDRDNEGAPIKETVPRNLPGGRNTKVLGSE